MDLMKAIAKDQGFKVEFESLNLTHLSQRSSLVARMS